MEVLITTSFDENSDLNMTYLGRIDMTRASKIKAEEKRPISEQGYVVEKLIDSTECQILLDMGASKMFIVHVILFKIQIFTLVADVHIQKSENPSREWPVH